MRQKLWAVLVAAFALVLVGCGEGTSISPSSPSSTPTPVPVTGPVVIEYKRPADKICRSTGSEWDRCTASVKVTSESWPYGYGFVGAEMEPQQAGAFQISEVAPAASRLGIYAIDPWDCPPVQICSERTGSGFSVNGVRLKDEPDVAHFAFNGVTIFP